MAGQEEKFPYSPCRGWCPGSGEKYDGAIVKTDAGD
jgi:hypothetical protein